MSDDLLKQHRDAIDSIDAQILELITSAPAMPRRLAKSRAAG